MFHPMWLVNMLLVMFVGYALTSPFNNRVDYATEWALAHKMKPTSVKCQGLLCTVNVRGAAEPIELYCSLRGSCARK